ncbi:MAG: putative metal-binding motif-containing protein [Candidatus Woesearchaeota archaeon]
MVFAEKRYALFVFLIFFIPIFAYSFPTYEQTWQNCEEWSFNYDFNNRNYNAMTNLKTLCNKDYSCFIGDCDCNQEGWDLRDVAVGEELCCKNNEEPIYLFKTKDCGTKRITYYNISCAGVQSLQRIFFMNYSKIIFGCKQSVYTNPEYREIGSYAEVLCCDIIQCTPQCEECVYNEVCSETGERRCTGTECDTYTETCLRETDGNLCGLQTRVCNLGENCVCELGRYMCDSNEDKSCKKKCGNGICAGCLPDACTKITMGKDNDNDSWDAQCGDCNDSNPVIFPQTNELCGDGIDNNCNNLIDSDEEGCRIEGEVCIDGDNNQICCIELNGTWIYNSCCGDDAQENWCNDLGVCIDGRTAVSCGAQKRCVHGLCVGSMEETCTDGDMLDECCAYFGGAWLDNLCCGDDSNESWCSNSGRCLSSHPFPLCDGGCLNGVCVGNTTGMNQNESLKCEDECALSERMCVDNVSYKICGNLDNDLCSEYSEPVSCEDNNNCTMNYCSDGLCKVKVIEECVHNFSISSLNSPPKISIADTIKVQAGQRIIIKPYVYDSEGDIFELTFSGWISSSEYLTTEKDIGEHQVIIRACDNISCSEKVLVVYVLKEEKKQAYLNQSQQDHIGKESLKEQDSKYKVKRSFTFDNAIKRDEFPLQPEDFENSTEVFAAAKEMYQKTIKKVEIVKKAEVLEYGDEKKTVVSITIAPKAKLYNISIIEQIPKTVAERAFEIEFNIQPVVIKDDPMVLWEIAELEKPTKIEYEINREVEIAEIEKTKTVVIAGHIGQPKWTDYLIPALAVPLIIITYLYFNRFKKYNAK